MKLVTKENGKVVRDFQKHFFWKSYLKIGVLMAILLMIGIGMIFISFSVGMFLIVFSVFFMGSLPLVQRGADNRLNKTNNLMMAEKLVEYEFLENKFSLKCYKEEELIANSVYEYNNVYRVEESKEYFFIYIASNQALPIAKLDLQEGQIEELAQILKGHCPKYKRYFK